MKKEEARELGWIVEAEGARREELIGRYLGEHGAAGLVGLFFEFVEVAKRLERGQREWMERECEYLGLVAPGQGMDMNLPTVAGAVAGLEFAVEPAVAGMCVGCAFRLGSGANQSLSTVTDAEACVRDGRLFLCHEVVDGSGRAVRACSGWVESVRREGGVVKGC